MESILAELTKELSLTPFGYRRSANKISTLIKNIQPMITEIIDSGVELPAHHQAQIDKLYAIIKNGKELFEKFNSSHHWNVFENVNLAGRIDKFDEELKNFVKSPILTNILVDIHRLQADSDIHSDPMKLAEEVPREILKQLIVSLEPSTNKNSTDNLINLIWNIQPMITEIMDSGMELPAQHEAHIDMLYITIEKGKEIFEKPNSSHPVNMFNLDTLDMRIEKIEKDIIDFIKSPIMSNILVDFHRFKANSGMHSDLVDNSLEEMSEQLGSIEIEGGGMVRDTMKLAEDTTEIESNDVSADVQDPMKLVEATTENDSNNTNDFEKFGAGQEVIEEWEFQYGPLRFAYEELSIATNEFEEKQLLGRGGFGQVYKGKLSGSNAKIAVKRTSHDSSQGMSEFLAEISTIGCLRHPNLVRLLGYCKHKEELFLVYDYMPNGSLDKYINRNRNQERLTWEQRFKIIKDVASALLYMHQEWKQVIIHRDIKPANVLIDHEMNARLGDFGLAKLCDHGFDPKTSKVAGTFGYMAPEFFRTGRATTNTDVYAFGVVMLEVVCGRRLFEQSAKKSEEVLGDWILDLWEKENIIDAAEESIRQKENKGQIELVLKLGVLCSHQAVSIRPDMSKVMRILNGVSLLPDKLLDVLRREKFRGWCEIPPMDMILEENSLGTNTFNSH